MAAENPDPIDPTLYLNRWIALVRGRVVGVGLTKAQAYRAAMQVRAKDKPLLRFVDAEGQVKTVDPDQLDLPGWVADQPLLSNVIKILQTHQIEAFLVGGAVRDLLLGRETIVDLDFALPGNGLNAAKIVANAMKAAYYPLDPERGTGRVVYEIEGPHGVEKNHLDFATFRGADLRADLTDRDFTINAMALRLSDPPELIDPLQGQHDLRQKTIRVAADSAFQDDPVRILRAVRQAAQFEFDLEPHTQQLLQAAAATMPTISGERQRDELLKLLNTPRPGPAMQALHQFEVLPHLLPEVATLAGVTQSPPHHLDVWEHTLAALTAWTNLAAAGFSNVAPELRAAVQQYFDEALAGEMTRRSLMPLALLLHDSGKPLTRTEELTPDGGSLRIRFLGHEQKSTELARAVMHRFHFSSQAISFVTTVVAHHMRPLSLAQAGSLSRRAIYRFFRDSKRGGSAAGPATVLHAWADHLATYPTGQGQQAGQALSQVVDTLLTAFFARQNEMIEPPPLLTGRDLIKMLALSEGRLIGLLLNRLKEAQAVGQVTDQAEALAFVEADPDFVRHRAGQP